LYRFTTTTATTTTIYHRSIISLFREKESASLNINIDENYLEGSRHPFSPIRSDPFFHVSHASNRLTANPCGNGTHKSRSLDVGEVSDVYRYYIQYVTILPLPLP
jgi:hypothetical protein